MIINMQYPHDLSNQKFDGKTHEIIPTSLIKINGNNDFYVLSYYDRNLDSIVKYNFSNLIFKKFVKEIDNSTKNIIIWS